MKMKSKPTTRQPKIGMTQSLRLLGQYLQPWRWRVALLALLLLGGIGLQLVAPQLIRRFLDLAQAGTTGRTLVETAVAFFIIVVVQKALSLLSLYVGEDVGWAATNQLRADLAQHVLGLDMGFHKLRTPGELIERIDGDVGNLAEYFSKLIVQVLGNGLLVLGILLLQFREDRRFGLIGLVYAAATLLFLRLIQPISVNLWGRIRQGFAEMFGYLEERLNGTEDIRANGGEAHVLAQLYPRMAMVMELRVRSALWGGVTFSTGHLLYILAWVTTLGLAGYAFLRGEITIGTVYLMAFYIGLLESPLKYIRRQIENMQRAMASIGRITEFMQLPSQLADTGTAALPHLAPAVRFRQVSFSYRDNLVGHRSSIESNGKIADENSGFLHDEPTTVLDEITFHLGARRVLGVLGRTGSGKTTLTRLLFRLYDVDGGAITLDDTDVRQVRLADLRQHIGMVTQDVQLFAASIRDNLTLFHNHDPQATPISDEQIHHALAELGLSSWLESLPQGLDTELATAGQGLSAGEGQLLALTRIFLRNPQLVILDEASSRLDPATEQRLEQAIDRLLVGRTAIIIAHRLATVQRADDILILENGRLANRANAPHWLKTRIHDFLNYCKPVWRRC